MEITDKDGKSKPQIYKEEWKREPEFASDREIKIFRNDDWETGWMSELKAGDKFRIFEVTFSNFIAGDDNEYPILEYEVIKDAYIAENGAWEAECFLLEELDES
ncbi:MAG: hypothetical protein ACXACY_21160 [Candidatus Hodarchaeales archaeon]|jgi:hypothetical protein